MWVHTLVILGCHSDLAALLCAGVLVLLLPVVAAPPSDCGCRPSVAAQPLKAPSYGTADPPRGSGHGTPDVFLVLRRCCSES